MTLAELILKICLLTIKQDVIDKVSIDITLMCADVNFQNVMWFVVSKRLCNDLKGYYLKHFLNKNKKIFSDYSLYNHQNWTS
ncbi:hypothetical protein BU598_08760 [Staphylococcus arlettae]|nr:hypothetical protein BU598_08760 [Staphylococcus arlettae]